MFVRLLVITFFAASIKAVTGATYLKITNLVCEPKPSYFQNHSCRIKAVNRYKAVVMMETFAKYQLRNVSVNVAAYARNSANVYNPFMINVTLNICQLLDKRTQGPYGKILKKLLATFTNVNHSCPYTGKLFARNAYLDTSLLPVVVPNNAYKVKLNFYEGYPRAKIGFIEFYLEFIETRN